MTKAPSSLQDLRRRIYRKAKSDQTYRFWGLFVHITKMETLEEAYRIAGVIRLDSSSSPCWLRSCLWWTCRFCLDPQTWHLQPSLSSTCCHSCLCESGS